MGYIINIPNVHQHVGYIIFPFAPFSISCFLSFFISDLVTLVACVALYALRQHRDYKFCTYAKKSSKRWTQRRVCLCVGGGGRGKGKRVERISFGFLHCCQYMYMTWLRQLLRSSGQLMTSLLTGTSALKAFALNLLGLMA